MPSVLCRILLFSPRHLEQVAPHRHCAQAGAVVRHISGFSLETLPLVHCRAVLAHPET